MLKYQGVPFKPAKVNLVDLQKLRVSSLVMSSSCANVVLWMYNYLYTNHISLQHVPVVSNNYHQLGIKSQFPNPNSKYSKRSSHMENVVNLVEFCISISEHLLNMSPKLTQKKTKITGDSIVFRWSTSVRGAATTAVAGRGRDSDIARASRGEHLEQFCPDLMFVIPSGNLT